MSLTTNKSDFAIGQTFSDTYPAEAAIWCNENNAHIEEHGDGYVIVQNAAKSAEMLFASLRAERDRRIAATDYLLMPDYPITDASRTTVQSYRQALRDLPAQLGAPWDGGGPSTPWPNIPSMLNATNKVEVRSTYLPR